MSKPEQVVFAYASGEEQPDGVPILTFLMPEASWSYMEGGWCHEFDLTKVGIPIKVMIGRVRNHAHAHALIGKANARRKPADVSHVDLHMGQEKKTEQ